MLMITSVEIRHVRYNVAIDESESLLIVIGRVHALQHVHLLLVDEVAEFWVDELV